MLEVTKEAHDRMKKICAGCTDLHERMQMSFYDDGGSYLNPPAEEMAPYSTDYRLHLDWVERVLEQSRDVCKIPTGTCPRYKN